MNIPPPGLGRRNGMGDLEQRRDMENFARGYAAELAARRVQEMQDEQLARRIQLLGLVNPGVEIYRVPADENGDDDNDAAPPPLPPAQRRPHPRIHNPPLGTEPQQQQQQQTPPLLRQHSLASRAYNRSRDTRPEERVIPRRTSTGAGDYRIEAAVHAPLRSGMMGTGVGSAMAGLTGRVTAEGRVEEWRRWVVEG